MIFNILCSNFVLTLNHLVDIKRFKSNKPNYQYDWLRIKVSILITSIIFKSKVHFSCKIIHMFLAVPKQFVGLNIWRTCSDNVKICKQIKMSFFLPLSDIISIDLVKQTLYKCVCITKKLNKVEITCCLINSAVPCASNSCNWSWWNEDIACIIDEILHYSMHI